VRNKGGNASVVQRVTKDSDFRQRVLFKESAIVEGEMSTQVLSTLKTYDRVHRAKLWGVAEYGVDVATASLYSCSDVCVCVGLVKSQQFAVGVELQHVTTPLHSLYI